MTMQRNDFFQYLQYEKRYSLHTLLAYKNDINQFYSFLSCDYKLDDIQNANHHIIRSWIVSLMEKQISGRSVNRKIAALKSYYKFLLKGGVLSENPMAKILSPKTSKKLPVFVEKTKMDLLLDRLDFGDGFSAVRNKLIIEMFYSTGIRLSELINLRQHDVDLKNCTIKVTGKRNKERIIPFVANLQKSISLYIDEKIDRGFSDDYFFVTGKGGKLYGKLVYRIVNHYLGKATTINKKSPHVLRHTFATHMLNNGADLNAIKEILGHANLSATQIYTHNTIEKLSNIYKQAHPRA